MNATTSFYLTLNESSKASIQAATANPRDYGAAQQWIDELLLWTTIPSEHSENIALSSAINEVAYGLYLLSSGLYRPAFTSLRLFIELGLGGVLFSTSELDLSEWIAGHKDISWSELVDIDNGVLSIRYADAFFPELRSEVPELNKKIRKIYRALSEYVHGNHEATKDLTKHISFSDETNSAWFKHFFGAAEVLLFALCLRFLPRLRADQRAQLGQCVRDKIGHISAIRAALDKG